MKFFRRSSDKRSGSSPRPIKMGRSLPLDTYYSPSARGGGRAASLPNTNTVKNGLKTVVRRLFQWGGIAALLIVLLLNVGLFSTGNKIRHSTDTDHSSRFRTDEEYKEVVDDVFRSSVLNRTKLTFNSSAFEQEVLSRLPEISDATAVIPLAGTRLQVGLTISDVLLRVQSQGTYGVVGTNGQLLSTSSSLELFGDYLDVPLITIGPAIVLESGTQVLTSDELLLITLLQNELDGSEPHRPRLKSITYQIDKRELQVRLFSTNFYAKMSVDRQPREQVGALLATVRELGNDSKSVEYIDVRVGGRVFVK